MSATADLLKKLVAMRLTQTEIAKRTNIPQPRLSRWLNGEVPDSADDALRLHRLHAELSAAEDSGVGAA